MQFAVKHRYTGKVQFTAEIQASESDSQGWKLRLAIKWAISNGAGLRYADLGWADLSGANLIGVDLRGADLFGADLRRADLRRADLCGVDLHDADLRGAKLTDAEQKAASPVSLPASDLME